ncbi:hypothetical protein CR513_11919, partial [Mucuna pruriens]
MTTFERKRYAHSVITVQASATCPKDPVNSFSNDDYKGMIPYQDDPMVISVVAAKFKVERMGLSGSNLKECSSVLIGFVKEQVEIRGTINLRTTFGVRPDAKAITIRFTIRQGRRIGSWKDGRQSPGPSFGFGSMPTVGGSEVITDGGFEGSLDRPQSKGEDENR